MFFAPSLFAQGIHTLPWPDWIENLRVFVFPILWSLAMSTMALGKVHEISWWKSLIAIMVSLPPMVGIMAVFIR